MTTPLTMTFNVLNLDKHITQSNSPKSFTTMSGEYNWIIKLEEHMLIIIIKKYRADMTYFSYGSFASNQTLQKYNTTIDQLYETLQYYMNLPQTNNYSSFSFKFNQHQWSLAPFTFEMIKIDGYTYCLKEYTPLIFQK